MRNLKRIIREVLSESDYTVEPELGTFPREKEVKGIFGQKYGSYVPADVLRYLRKNPALIFKRLYEIYGEKSFEYLNTLFDLSLSFNLKFLSLLINSLTISFSLILYIDVILP